jgi:hypothetical protein
MKYNITNKKNLFNYTFKYCSILLNIMKRIIILTFLFFITLGITYSIQVITITIDDEVILNKLSFIFEEKQLKLLENELLNLNTNFKEKLYNQINQKNNQEIIIQLNDFLLFIENNQSAIINDDLLKEIQSSNLNLIEIIDKLY